MVCFVLFSNVLSADIFQVIAPGLAGSRLHGRQLVPWRVPGAPRAGRRSASQFTGEDAVRLLGRGVGVWAQAGTEGCVWFGFLTAALGSGGPGRACPAAGRAPV